VCSIDHVAQTANEKAGALRSAGRRGGRKWKRAEVAQKSRGEKELIFTVSGLFTGPCRRKTWRMTSILALPSGRSFRYNKYFEPCVAGSIGASAGTSPVCVAAVSEPQRVAGRFYCRLPILTWSGPYRKPCTQRWCIGAAARRQRGGDPYAGLSAAGEILIRVEACGICHTDLKKIEYNLAGAAGACMDMRPGGSGCRRGQRSHQISNRRFAWWPSTTFRAGNVFTASAKNYAQWPGVQESRHHGRLSNRRAGGVRPVCSSDGLDCGRTGVEHITRRCVVRLGRRWWSRSTHA